MVRATIVLVVYLVCTAAGCASTPGAQSSQSPTPSALPDNQGAIALPTVLPSTSPIVVSDAVPSLDELRAIGLSDAAAECFIDTIDPDRTGRVANAERFTEAFAACL